MAGADDTLVPLDLPPEVLHLLIQQQNAKLIEEGEKKRNAPGVDWSQPYFWPFSAGNDPATGELVGLDVVQPQLLKDLMSALMLPSDVMSGQVDPMSPEGLGRAAAFPLAVGGPGTVAAMAKGAADPNLLSIFAGQNSRTADLDALANAHDMAAKLSVEGKGVRPGDMEDIFAKTGWFAGPDGKMRYEIPDYVAPGRFMPKEPMIPVGGSENAIIDALAKLMGDGQDAVGNVRQFLDHPELYNAYPELGETLAKVGYKPRQEGVNYHSVAGIDAYGPTQTDIMSVMLHELQHGVQRIEGFAGGGNPNWTKNVLANLAPSADQQLLYPDPYQIYRALMGETEARAVQSRYELGTALEPTPASMMFPDGEVPQGWGFAEGKGTGGQFQTTPYFRTPGVDADMTGSYDIPFNLQIDPRMLNDKAATDPLKQKLLALKTALASQ